MDALHCSAATFASFTVDDGNIFWICVKESSDHTDEERKQRQGRRVMVWERETRDVAEEGLSRVFVFRSWAEVEDAKLLAVLCLQESQYVAAFVAIEGFQAACWPAHSVAEQYEHCDRQMQRQTYMIRLSVMYAMSRSTPFSVYLAFSETSQQFISVPQRDSHSAAHCQIRCA